MCIRDSSGRKHIICYAVGHFGQDIRCRRSNGEYIRPLGQGNMLHLPGRIALEHIRHHRMLGERLQGQGGEELLCVAGHNAIDLHSRLTQPGNNLGSLISGNAPGNAQYRCV